MVARSVEKKVRILRAVIRDQPGQLGRLAQLIGDVGASIGDIVKVRAAGEYNVREIEIYYDDEEQLEVLKREIGRAEGIELEQIFDPVLEIHRGGKIRMRSIVSVDSLSDLRKIYTPGVATTCLEIQAHPERVRDYTSLGHTVGIVTNGTAILGLGNIGVHAGLPVMEGKAVLLDKLVGLSGVPILIPTRDTERFIETVIQISPSFGAINLEDIAAPECFEIESRLAAELPIPVMHDDQHGTGVVVLAALLNAMREIDARLELMVVGIIGLGAAGMGIAKLLRAYGVKGLVGSDTNPEALRRLERLGGESLRLERVMEESQVVIATTGRPGLISPELVRKDQILLALSNPSPEIEPQVAREAGARFAADGRSLNNALGFPGIFRGALQARARRINDAMKVAAAEAIAEFAEPGELVPSLLSVDVHHAVSDAVEQAARESGATSAEPDAEPA
ncbi:MAG: malic enzyme-like NAD(P)-binding protein [Myxococcota bacterium]